jgi:hypothetical protein
MKIVIYQLRIAAAIFVSPTTILRGAALKKSLIATTILVLLCAGFAYLFAAGTGGEEPEDPDPCFVTVRGDVILMGPVVIGCESPGNKCSFTIAINCP